MPRLPNTPTPVIRIAHTVAGASFRSEFKYTGGPALTTDLTAIASQARAAWATDLASLCGSDKALTATIVSDLSQNTLPNGEDLTVVPGSHVSTSAPASVAALLELPIPVKYRGSKPKIWLPFGTDGDLASDTSWSSGFIANVNAAWANYRNAIGAIHSGTVSVSTQCAISYFGPPTIPNTGPGRNKFKSTQRTTPIVYDVGVAALRVKFGSQRRRLNL